MDWENLDWQRIRDVALQLHTDGCSGPTFPVYVHCCYLHDIQYRTGKTIDGEPTTRGESDKLFRWCIQARSPFGRFSPMSWWRWVAVRLFGRSSWKGE